MLDFYEIERLKYLSISLVDLLKAPLPESPTWQAALQTVINEIAKFSEVIAGAKIKDGAV